MGERQRPQAGFGLLRADDSRPAHVDIGVALRGDGLADIRLIPDLPLLHAILEVTDERSRPIVPGHERRG
jgi:hypothetical protein